MMMMMMMIMIMKIINGNYKLVDRNIERKKCVRIK